MALLSTGAALTISAVAAAAGAGYGAYSAERAEKQQKKARRDQRAANDESLAQAARAEREADRERQRAARETPDLMSSFDAQARKKGASAPLLPGSGPLSLGGNSLLGL